jgi:hypothetical protein
MFTVNTPEEIITGAIEFCLDRIVETLEEEGVITKREKPEHQAFERQALKDQIRAYVLSGAPFRHLEVVYAGSHTRLMFVVNFDIFNRATFGEVRAEKTSYNDSSDVDFTYLNRNLAIAISSF